MPEPFLDIQPPGGKKPVHVLVVMVGRYIRARSLPGAGAFAGELASFWADPARIFPDDLAIGTVTVLASDPAGPVSLVRADGSNVPADLPTYANCAREIQAWADRIVKTEGMGILHWIGHGKERAIDGGKVVSLLCDGPHRAGSNVQDGLNWSATLGWLNDVLRHRMVACFIDTCRIQGDNLIRYAPIAQAYDAGAPDSVMVFRTAMKGEASFWLERPNAQTVRAGCSGQALGTRAFVAALESFGARWSGPSPTYPVPPQEIHEAASALIERWSRHQKLPVSRPVGPKGRRPDPILMTSTPRSVIDYKAPRATRCEAYPVGGSREQSENGTSPFQFRLGRSPHHFVLDSAHRSQLHLLVHPFDTLSG